MGLNDQSPTAVARTIIGNLECLSSSAHLDSGIQDPRFQRWAANLEQGVIGILKLADRKLRRASTTTGKLVFPTSDTGRSLLHLAASLLVKELIDRGANVDQPDENGYTAAYYSTLFVLSIADSGIVHARGRAAQTVTFQTRLDDANEVKAHGKQSDCPGTSDPAEPHHVPRSIVDARQVNSYDPFSVRATPPNPSFWPR
jgi:hypothetical protein